MERIADGISTITGVRIGRVYVIEARDGLTLIDTGLPGSLPRIERDLVRSGRSLSEVKRILITHAHWDHHGSLAAVKAATGAAIYVHGRHESAVVRGEKLPIFPAVETLGRFDRVVWKYWLRPARQHRLAVPVDRELQEGDRLDEVLPGLEVVDLPGHAPGQCGFWHPERRILFGGDVMMRAPTGHLTLPLIAATADLAEAKRSVQKVAELNINTLCLGHGKPYSGAASDIHMFAKTM